MRDLNRAHLFALPVVAASICGGTVLDARAQTLHTDRAVWELATWPGIDTEDDPQSQYQSREDWFYSITQSVPESGPQDGFVAAGYSTYYSLTSTECRDAGECDDTYAVAR